MYQEDFKEHLEDFVDISNDYDVPVKDRTYFLKIYLLHGARQYLKLVVTERSKLENFCRLFR